MYISSVFSKKYIGNTTMKKINIILLCTFVLLANIFAASNKAVLKKPGSAFAPIEKIGMANNEDAHSMSFSIGCLTNSGDLSEFDTATSLDFLIKCKNSCTILGKELDLGYGLSISPVNSDEDATSDLSLASFSLHVFPKLNLPVSFDFAGGLGVSPNENDAIGMFGILSMNMFYKLPFCENVSLGLQYKNIMEPVDVEISFSRLNNVGFALRIDG